MRQSSGRRRAKAKILIPMLTQVRPKKMWWPDYLTMGTVEFTIGTAALYQSVSHIRSKEQFSFNFQCPSFLALHATVAGDVDAAYRFLLLLPPPGPAAVSTPRLARIGRSHRLQELLPLAVPLPLADSSEIQVGETNVCRKIIHPFGGGSGGKQTVR